MELPWGMPAGEFATSPMRKTPWIVGLVLLAAAGAAGSVPVEDFARTPLFSNAQLSPDGEHVAFIREHEGKISLFLTNLRSRALTIIDAGDVRGASAPKEAVSFSWLSSRRIAYLTAAWNRGITGMAAVNVDGSQAKTFTGSDARNPGHNRLYATRILPPPDKDGESILMLDDSDSRGEKPKGMDVLKVDTVTGLFQKLIDNPGNVVAWAADSGGNVRLGIAVEDMKSWVIRRDSSEAPWKALAPLEMAHGHMGLVGLDESTGEVLVTALSAQKRWAIFPADPNTGTFGDVLVANPNYDILPPRHVPAMDGCPLARAVFSEKKLGLAGVYFAGETPQVRWLDAEHAGMQKAIDRALRGTFNLIVGWTRDERRLLVLSYSDRDPGTYYLFDVADNSLTPIATRMGWLKPEEMAQTFPAKYAARDGVTIGAYLTFPAGKPRKDLPLVVLPHDEPRARDVWGFDPLVQMLASRGYAVLQANYRGSTGFGDEFSGLGRHEIGRAIQNDIEDGVRWAVAQGLADAKRIAIVGTGYGGYSALFALGNNPDLYRCGVSIGGVTDWAEMFEDNADTDYRRARSYWRREIGDPGADQALLRSISPVSFAGRITAPVLIIQCKEDDRVPLVQAKAMIEALEKAGHAPETLVIPKEDHTILHTEARTAEFRRIAEFLGKYLGQ